MGISNEDHCKIIEKIIIDEKIDENFLIINLREKIDEKLMKNFFPHTLL